MCIMACVSTSHSHHEAQGRLRAHVHAYLHVHSNRLAVPIEIRFPLHTRCARPQRSTNGGCSARNAPRSSRWRPLRRCNACVCVAVCVACSVMLVGMRCLLAVVTVNRFTPRYPQVHVHACSYSSCSAPRHAPTSAMAPASCSSSGSNSPHDALLHEHSFVRNAPAQYLHTHIHSDG